MSTPPAYGMGKQLERYAALAKWYELALHDISRAYSGDNDYPGILARQALAQRHSILTDSHITR